MTYQNFFSLDDSAFRLTPDPEYFFPSNQHNEALETLLYSVETGVGFVQLTGQPGVGKTLLIRRFIEQLGKDINTALILYPRLNAEELFKVILEDLGLAPDDMQSMSKEILLRSFRDILLESAKQGIKTVVIIDEAQEIPEQTLEELRLLSNLETDKTKLLQIILVGQLELEKKLSLDHLKQLYQRITIRYRLTPFSHDDTVNYIRHRLGVAGGGNIERFQPDAVELIHKNSKGIPRVINSVCERALMAAYVDEKSAVNKEHVREAIHSLDNNSANSRPEKEPRRKKPQGFFIMTAAVLISCTALYFTNETFQDFIVSLKTSTNSIDTAETADTTSEQNATRQNRVLPMRRVKNIDEHKEKKEKNIVVGSDQQKTSSKTTNGISSPAADTISDRKIAAAKPGITPDRHRPFLLPAGWSCIIIEKQTATTQLYKGNSAQPSTTVKMGRDITLANGIYLLGQAGEEKFFFNHQSFFSWEYKQTAADWLRRNIIGDTTSRLVPVVVLSSSTDDHDTIADDIKNIQTMTKNWADTFAGKDSAQLANYYDDSLITYHLMHNRPTVASREQLVGKLKKIFRKNKAISLQISEPLCIINSDDPTQAVAIFHQRFISSRYSDSGIKVLYLRKDTTTPDQWRIRGQLWLPSSQDTRSE